MFKAKGKIIYDPKSDASKFNFWWCKVDVHPSIIHYYQYWVKRELGIHLNTPIWKAHITVVRGEEPKKKFLWKKYEGREIVFEYSPALRMSETYTWIQVESPDLEELRVELGLKPQPRVPFHITIGNTKNVTPMKKKAVPFQLFPWENEKDINR